MVVYELTCLLDPKIKERKKLIAKIEKWITGIGGKIKKKEDWGKKELAYRIGKNTEAFYFFWKFEAEKEKINKLFPKIKLEEKIIRHLLVRTS